MPTRGLRLRCCHRTTQSRRTAHRQTARFPAFARGEAHANRIVCRINHAHQARSTTRGSPHQGLHITAVSQAGLHLRYTPASHAIHGLTRATGRTRSIGLRAICRGLARTDGLTCRRYVLHPAPHTAKAISTVRGGSAAAVDAAATAECQHRHGYAAMTAISQLEPHSQRQLAQPVQLSMSGAVCQQ